jgi:aminoglycoside phosphotransferase (APT) family kinase protein
MIHTAPSRMSDDRVHRLTAGLRDYVGGQLGQAVEITGVSRLAGGTSHATWSFDANASDGAVLPLVMRQDFEAAPIEADCPTEFRLLTSLHAAGQPVPRPRWAAAGAALLSTPFMITERMSGGDVRKILAQPAALIDKLSLGDELTRIQAAVHAMDWRRYVAGIVDEPAGNCARHEVERWAGIVERHPEKSGPLLAAALNWLRANAPENDQLSLLHGDFKTNNILSDGARHVVTDWEMSHVGDPIEDLAWTMLWTTKYDLVGGLLSPDDYIAAYSRHAQRAVDRTRLFFWRLFSQVKLSAIFLSGMARAPTAPPIRPTLGILGRGGVCLEAEIADLLLLALGGDAR